MSPSLRLFGRLGLESAVWCGVWGRHSRHATADLQLLGTHGYVTPSKIIVASRPKRGTGILPSWCWASNVFPPNNTMLCVSRRMASGGYGSPEKQCGGISLFYQHRERLPPMAKGDRKKQPPRDVPVVFKVLVYHTILWGVLVVEYSDHKGRHMTSPALLPLQHRD